MIEDYNMDLAKDAVTEGASFLVLLQGSQNGGP